MHTIIHVHVYVMHVAMVIQTTIFCPAQKGLGRAQPLYKRSFLTIGGPEDWSLPYGTGER